MRSKTIYITPSDKARLDQMMLFQDLFVERERKTLRRLEYDISRGRVVSDREIPSDVVTTHSQVVLEEIDGQLVFTAKLVFPEDADDAKYRISILTDLGSELIGSRTGDVIEWSSSDGTRQLRIRTTSNVSGNVPPTHVQA